jgi:DNA repair protein RadA/Sms
MVCAVLTRRARIPLGNQDVIVNVTGGLRINEPSADLGMALAIASSMTNVPIDADIAAIGELGLTGEVRSVPQMDRRVREAVRLGLRRCLVPAGTARELESIAGAEIIPIESLAQAVSVCLPNAAIGANVG